MSSVNRERIVQYRPTWASNAPRIPGKGYTHKTGRIWFFRELPHFYKNPLFPFAPQAQLTNNSSSKRTLHYWKRITAFFSPAISNFPRNDRLSKKKSSFSKIRLPEPRKQEFRRKGHQDSNWKLCTKFFEFALKPSGWKENQLTGFKQILWEFFNFYFLCVCILVSGIQRRNLFLFYFF
jgi:hypothetical protein